MHGISRDNYTLSTVLNYTAPTAPRNVTPTNITRSSITITWLAPEPTNGIIESYTIQVVRIDDSQMLPDIDVRPPDMRDYNITGLMEHVNYSIVIVASTDKGMGDGSEAIIVQTLEHRKWLRSLSPSVPLSPSPLSNTSTLISKHIPMFHTESPPLYETLHIHKCPHPYTYTHTTSYIHYRS